MLRTRRFQSLMDRLGRNRISRPVGWFLLYVMPVVAGLGFLLFLVEFLAIFSAQAHQVGMALRNVTPLAYLGLPGINPYLPIVDGWLALIFAMIVHEGAHGVVARSIGLPVKASGLLFFLVVPIGAFVEVDEEALKLAKGRDSARVWAAGAGINFALGIVFLLLLFSLISTMTPAAHGIGVTSVATPSPAATAGIKPGDFIVAVNGIHYNDGVQFKNASWYRAGNAISVIIWRNGESLALPVTLGARPNVTVACDTSVDVGKASKCIATLSGFLGNVTGEPIGFSSNGSGAFNSTACELAMGSCGVTYTPSEAEGSPQTIAAAYSGDARNAANAGATEIAVGPAARAASKACTGTARLGAQTTCTEFAVDAPTAQASPSSLGYLGVGDISYSSLQHLVSTYTNSFSSRPITYICIPTLPNCQDLVPFSPQLSTFYSSAYGTLLIPVANLVYWFFFINFNLALFNALPIFPLDGGQAFKVGLKGATRGRLSEKWLSNVSVAVTLLVLALILTLPLSAYLGLI